MNQALPPMPTLEPLGGSMDLYDLYDLLRRLGFRLGALARLLDLQAPSFIVDRQRAMVGQVLDVMAIEGHLDDSLPPDDIQRLRAIVAAEPTVTARLTAIGGQVTDLPDYLDRLHPDAPEPPRALPVPMR
jgi:hypothetical protein